MQMTIEVKHARIVWVTIGLVALVAAMVGAPEWIVAVSMSLGFAFEGLTIADRREGNTLSENVWAFIKDNPARIPLAVGFSFWLAWQFLVLSETVSLGYDAGHFALAAGFLGWLIPHFIWKGKYG